MKKYRSNNVYNEAVERLAIVFKDFERVYVSFSGGKDSGVLLNMALDAAKLVGYGKLPVLCVDLEAQYKHTVDYCDRMMGRDDVVPYRVCLPIHLRNAVSQITPHWLCWDPDCKDAWVRNLPKTNINDETYFPFFKKGMEFEEFTPKFGEWLANGKKTCCLVGIRSDESLNRYRTLVNEKKEMHKDYEWTTKLSDTLYNAYPLYDWRVEDLWTANGKMNYDYNKIYDLMHMAGLSLHEMRLCQPYGDDQRKGLWLFKILEPETWARVVNRVEGANYGNRYSESQSHTMGNFKVHLPAGHTYKSYSHFLLDTMPPHAAAHYRAKIAKFIRWWRKEGQLIIPDAATDSKLEAARKVPSWRRICKVLLKNDWWCKGLSFSQTKKEMERQLAVLTKYSNI